MVTSASAEPTHHPLSLRLSDLIHASLTEKIADAEIRTPSLDKICSQNPLNEFQTLDRVRLVEDRPNGSALFEVTGKLKDGSEKSELVQTPYTAWKKVVVAARRIYPNTKVQDQDFKVIEMNVASGPIREYRGILIPAEGNFSRLQTRQTILENQYVTTSSVERQPDVRRGDTLRLDMVSGDLTLSTQATASENASIGDRIRVMTSKTKKEVVGTVREDHSVEVTL
jgi:flagella basal body P-ring formation protein FlgA